MKRPYSIDSYVIDTLMADLVGHDHRPSAFLVYLAVATAAGGGKAALSLSMIAERTGLSKRTVQNAIAALRGRELIELSRRSVTAISEYRALMPWRR